jgi:hypothetical protein
MLPQTGSLVVEVILSLLDINPFRRMLMGKEIRKILLVIVLPQVIFGRA